MMLANQTHRARLRAFLAFFLYEADFRAHPQLVESVVENGVAMKVDLAPIGRFDESGVFAREEPRHTAVIFHRMEFHLAAQIALGVLDLPLRRAKGLSHRDHDMLTFRLVIMRPVDDNVLVPGHRNSDVDLERSAVTAPLFFTDDCDMTARNSGAEFFEALSQPENLGSNSFRRVAVLKGDLDWRLHEALLSLKWLPCAAGSERDPRRNAQGAGRSQTPTIHHARWL
ncbi:hypothetical protein MPC1_2060005 [Methylocella tundrae]|nr:hypothetical protein MPC1_2060005 [Methylocella tundrae]